MPMRNFCSRLNFANVVSVAALFVALGGSSYAAVSVSGKNVRDNSLTSADVKNRSLGSIDFAPNQLPAGTRGANGSTGPVGKGGADGEQGLQGLTGLDGADGLDGAAGINGSNGLVGAAGPQGEPGQPGEQGPQGEPGKDGAAAFSVSALVVDGEVAAVDPKNTEGQGKEGEPTKLIHKAPEMTGVYCTTAEELYGVGHGYFVTIAGDRPGFATVGHHRGVCGEGEGPYVMTFGTNGEPADMDFYFGVL